MDDMAADARHLALALDPDDIGVLRRQPEFRGAKADGRVRRAKPTTIGLVWHDTPEGELAASGRALVQQTRAGVVEWRLERMVPDGLAAWPPGTPAPLIGRYAAMPVDLGQPLLPLAAFAGQEETRLVADAAIELTLLQGDLRTVTATRRVCRVGLAGPGAAELALAWAGRMRLGAPRAALSAEAFALARQAEPKRPLGAPLLSAEQTVGDAFAFIVAHLAGVILHHAPGATIAQGDGWGPEPVHQMRVALRRLRSAILLFRRAVGCAEVDAVTARLKELGRALGPARDWDVFTGGAGADIAAAFTEDAGVAALLAAAERRRLAGYAALKAYLEGPAWRGLGIALASLVQSRPWERETGGLPAEIDPETDTAGRHAALLTAPLRHFASRALQRRLKAVIAPGDDLRLLPAEALHDIRLHTKKLRYAAEFFSPLYPGKRTRRFLRHMADLQEHLGVMNDGAVAAGLMADLAGRGAAHQVASGVVRGFVAARATGSRRRIERAWAGFLKQEPFWS